MKNQDKRSTLLLSSIIICLILGIIIYPSFKLSSKNKAKEEFRGEISNIVSEAEKYYLDKNQEISDNIIFTIKNGKIIEDGLDYNGELPEEGTIVINKNGEIQIVVNNKIWCATKKYNESSVNVVDYNSECEVKNTKNIGNINVGIVNTGDGLYEENGSFYYKGLNPNNYLVIDDVLFRILGLDENNNIKLVSNDVILEEYWDVKQKSLNYEVIDSSKLGYILENSDNKLLNNLIKNKFILEYTWNQDSFNYADNKLYIEYSNQKGSENEFVSIFGLIDVSDYVKASTDTNCKKDILRNPECGKNNYLNINKKFYTLSISNDSIWSISEDGKVYESSVDIKLGVRISLYLENSVILEGKGTFENPYKIVTK